MVLFATIVNSFWVLTIVIKSSLLDVTGFLYPSLIYHSYGHQSIDLLYKSIFCFLYVFNNGLKWVDEVSM